MPYSSRSRRSISSAADLVYASASISSGDTPDSIRKAYRPVSVRVFPEPAPAMTRLYSSFLMIASVCSLSKDLESKKALCLSTSLFVYSGMNWSKKANKCFTFESYWPTNVRRCASRSLRLLRRNWRWLSREFSLLPWPILSLFAIYFV